MDDCDAWVAYPWGRRWFNKLWVAQRLGYVCGPCGVAPSVSAKYVVRPIYNLSGMGAGATVKYIDAGCTRSTPPGYFWCEYFTGRHLSVTYAHGVPVHTYEGFNTAENLSKFHRWLRVEDLPPLPPKLTSLRRLPALNVEYIGSSVIEVHLRGTPDPLYDELIPIWAGQSVVAPQGWQFVWALDDADGYLPWAEHRQGFLVRSKPPTPAEHNSALSP